MSSKQDGYASRTAADLERKYNFGQTFAEVYGLISDARKAAEEAQSSVDMLDQEAIFNLLTNFGEWEGVYRGEDGGVYINASYIKSGKLAAEYIDAENLKVAAANITGELVATQINTKDLKVLAANITGKLNAGQIDATELTVSAANVTGVLKVDQIDSENLKISAANITGTLTADQIDTSKLKVSSANITGTMTIGQLPSTVAKTSDIPKYMSDLHNDMAYQTATGVVKIVHGEITADYVNALGVYADHLESTGSNSQRVTIEDGIIDFYSGYIMDNDYGYLEVYATSVLSLRSNGVVQIHVGSGYWEFTGSGIYHYNRYGNIDNEVMLEN